MRVQLKVSRNAIVEAQHDKMTELFEQLAEMQEIFEEEVCGCCQHPKIRFIVRQNDAEDKFYEMMCTKCYARLQFGCKKKGNGLFPKRRWDSLSKGDQEGRADQKDYAEKHFGNLPNHGWYKYTKKQEK